MDFCTFGALYANEMSFGWVKAPLLLLLYIAIKHPFLKKLLKSETQWFAFAEIFFNVASLPFLSY